MPAKRLSMKEIKGHTTLVLGPGPEQTPGSQELWQHFPSGGRQVPIPG